MSIPEKEIKIKYRILENRQKPVKMSPLNEAIIGNCNMEIPEEELKITGQVSIDYADAINTRKKRIEKIKDDFKDQDKVVDEFIKDSQTENKPEVNADMKKMKLAENLFEDANSDYYVGDEEAGRVYQGIDNALNAVKYLLTSKNPVRVVAYDIALSDNSELHEAQGDTKLYKQAEKIADTLDEFIAKIGKIEDIEDYISSSEFEVLNKTCEILQDFAMQYSHIMDNEDVFESVEATKIEEATDVEQPEKKRTRAPNDEKYGIDFSDTDLWLQVYDELDASLGNEGEGQQVNRHVKGRRGERYEKVLPSGDNDIVVYATKPEEFEFAKKVADFYGVKAEEPQPDTNKRTNSYYKWKMYIRIPKDAEPKQF